jgi:hypothetical protein
VGLSAPYGTGCQHDQLVHQHRLRGLLSSPRRAKGARSPRAIRPSPFPFWGGARGGGNPYAPGAGRRAVDEMREQGADARLSIPAKNDAAPCAARTGLQARQPAEPIRPLRSFLGAPVGVIPSCGLVLHRERASTAPLVGRVGWSVQRRRREGISWWVRGGQPTAGARSRQPQTGAELSPFCDNWVRCRSAPDTVAALHRRF